MAQVAFRSNSTIATINSTRQGLGVAPLPCFLGDGDTELVRLSDPPDALTMDLWVLTHPDLRNTARVKVLMTHLIEVLEAERLGFEGTRQ